MTHWHTTCVGHEQLHQLGYLIIVTTGGDSHFARTPIGDSLAMQAPLTLHVLTTSLQDLPTGDANN